jgi:ABC-type antimicrobial peptide transport system permease subunit
MIDLRYALRLLFKSPLFTIAIVLTSALGIGATTTIFSVVNAVLVRPLPFADPERLMQVAEKNDKLRLPAFSAPLVINPPNEMRLNHVLFVVGRLKPGVTRQAAQMEMDTIAARVGQEYPEVRDWGINLITFTDTFVSSQLRTALLMLLGAVGLVLLIVSANIANLLLARATARRPEIVVRAALGAGTGRLIRQLLIESLVLSTAGGILGIAAAFWAVRLLESSLPPNVLPVPNIGVDRTVLAFAVGVTCVTGLLFGFAPAWHAARTDVSTALRDAGRSSSGSSRAMVRRVLASGELALAAVLLVGATLLIRSLIQLQHVPLGFDPEGVISLQVSLPPTKYPMANDENSVAARSRVRPAGDPAPVIAAIRRHVHAMDPDVPIIRPMTEWVSGSAAQPRLNATLLGVFAVVALLLAAIGTYGVLAYSVSLRTKEIGLRMALGAERGTVRGLVVREGMTAGLTGIAIGIAAAIAASRLIGALVFGVSVRDASTYLGVSILLAVVAFVSCVVPAIRASKVDPMTALRLD